MISGYEMERSGTVVNIYDMLGRSMIRTTYSSTISTYSLPQGFYIVHILNEGGSISHMHKIVIN